LGYINYKKNIPLTLEIFKDLYDTDNRYKLFLAGEFQDLRTFNYIQYFIKEYKLENNIILEGWKNLDEKKEWFRRIDYILISSIDEGLCYAAAEAMCSGIKPVLHNCEGIKAHYPKKYIFDSIEAAIKLIKADEYDSKEYRSFIEENYSIVKQCENLNRLIWNLTNENTKAINSFDLTYSERYTDRNNVKVSAILKNIKEVYYNALDIGCNKGYVIESLILKKYIKYGYGVDLDKKVISEKLLENNNFKFYEEDIIKFKFEQNYDIIIYNSVHHHVFGKYGKETALGLFKNIINHCNRVLIFETGMIKEVGKYYWKDELLKHFGSDEVHMKVLLKLIGDRLENIEEIENLDIHGVKRPIFKISLYPINTDEVYSNLLKDSELKVLKSYRRTIGSINQRLMETEVVEKKASNLYNQISYYKLKKQEVFLFGKKYEGDHYKELKELNIIEQVEHPRAIKLEGISRSYGLLFPYLGWKAIDELDFSKIKEAYSFKKEVEDFFKYAEEKNIRLKNFFNMDYAVKSKRLIDLVDLHAHNFLVNVSSGVILDWKVIDFEHYAEDNFERNKGNLINIQKFIG
jgi:hypothetical protein